MKLRSAFALATVLAVLAAPAAVPAAAGALPHTRSLHLAVTVSGVHVDRWHVEEGGYPDAEEAWVEGGGTQTLRFATKGALAYAATAFSGSLPGGRRLAPLVLAPLDWGPLAGTAARAGDWHYSDGELCDREGGCEDEVPVVPLHQAQSCPDRAVPIDGALETVEAGPTRTALRFTSEPAALDGLWSSCPPDIDGATRPLALAQPLEVAFGGAIKQILHLARGGSVTVRGAASRGAVDGIAHDSCPRLSGAGRQECATTKITLKVTRTR
jgi:hypothetical protein